MNGQRVDTALEFVGKQIVDQTVTVDPALPFEGVSHNMNSEMSLFPSLMPGMPRMLIGFIEHPQAHGSEGIGQLL